MMSRMTNYIEWLVTSSGLGLDRSIDINSIVGVLTLLQNTDFTFSSMDRPRVDDAFDLRSIYVDNCIKINDDPRVYGCSSVLEVLIAFAIRVDMEVVGNPSDPRPDILFLNWIKNLGVLITDDKWTVEKSNLVRKKLSKWMNRDYKDDGKGSIFPLKSPSFDFYKADMWDQMYKFYYNNT